MGEIGFVAASANKGAVTDRFWSNVTICSASRDEKIAASCQDCPFPSRFVTGTA